MSIEARYGRREFLRGATIVATAAAILPLAEAFSPSQASAESDRNIIDITYREFADLPENHERLLKIIRESPKSLRVTLTEESRLERLPTEAVTYLVDSNEALTTTMIMETAGRNHLTYVFIPADEKRESQDFAKGKALIFELVPIPEDKAIALAKNSALPFVFRGITPAPTPTPSPTSSPSPTPCSFFELPCYRPKTIEYASFR